MIINNNMNAMNAHRNMGMNINQNGNSMEKLSSGLRINRAGDDAAGLAISEKMRGQIRGLDMASKNAQDGISLIQTAEGALNETHAILQRMRELTVQAANDTNTDDDRGQLQLEVEQLIEEIDRIAETTEFNTMKLLDETGGDNGTFSFQIGANGGQELAFKISKMDAEALTVDDLKLDYTSNKNSDFKDELKKVDDAIEKVSTQRAELGAYQNRLDHTIKNLDTSAENLQAAESRIRDVDMAKEMMEFTRTNILNQASQAMLAQANQQPQAVLQLLR